MDKFYLHPVLIHFPIAFYFLELLLLILFKIKKQERYRDFAGLSFKIGYLFMIPALIAGYIDAGGYINLKGLVLTHFLLGIAMLVFATLRAAYSRWGKAGRTEAVQIAGALLLNILTALTGHFGAGLVYG